MDGVVRMYGVLYHYHVKEGAESQNLVSFGTMFVSLRLLHSYTDFHHVEHGTRPSMIQTKSNHQSVSELLEMTEGDALQLVATGKATYYMGDHNVRWSFFGGESSGREGRLSSPVCAVVRSFLSQDLVWFG